MRTLVMLGIVASLPACGGGGTAVELTIDADPPLALVQTLAIDATGGGRARHFDVTLGRAIPPTVSVTIEVPSDLGGTFHVDVSALDGAAAVLAQQSGETTLEAGKVKTIALHLVGSGGGGGDLAMGGSGDMATGGGGDMTGAVADMTVLADLAMPADLTTLPDLACNLGAGPPYTLQGTLSNPTEVLVDATYVYWVDVNGIERTLKAGCGAIETVASVFAPTTMVADASYIYYATPTTLVTGGYYYITLQGSAVYGINSTDNKLYSCATAGCSATPTLLSGALTTPGRLSANASFVYIIKSSSSPTNKDGNIMMCPLAGCGTNNQNLGYFYTATFIESPNDIVATATEVYYATYNQHTVEKCSATSGCTGNMPTVVLASGSWNPSRLALDGTYVYIANLPDGTVLKCAQSGCGNTPTVLGATEPQASGIAVDSTGVYFTRRQDPGGALRLYR